MKDYNLHRMLRGLRRAGLSWRLLDNCYVEDRARLAFFHIDLTELPAEFGKMGRHYAHCINGKATTIDRRLYSRLELKPDERHDGPVIVKTILNSQGYPELRYAARQTLSGRLGHVARKIAIRGYKQSQCPEYQVLASIADVPAAIWDDDRLMVERFAPGTLALPIIKYRLNFFLDVECNTRSTCASPLCDEESVETREIAPDVPEEVRRVRRDLHLEYGAIDYFIVDGECFVIDANKTVGMSEDWIADFPAAAKFVEDITSRLVDWVGTERL